MEDKDFSILCPIWTDINELKRDYDSDVTDLSAYVSQCQEIVTTIETQNG